MGKRRKLAAGAHAHKPGVMRGGVMQRKKPDGGPQPRPQKKGTATKNPQHAEPTIPFSAEDRILLVGDGDLSFAAALVAHHGCVDVTATVLEKSAAELADKYPSAPAHAAAVEADGCGRVLYDVDATKMAPFVSGGGKKRSSKAARRDADADADAPAVVGIMDRVIFNFPHVGGKSTDVNRQVRYNQELLVGFFGRAAPSLAPRGKIVVTLFEGEPYTLWNIRDLARHCGLQVERSFRFQAAAYPGYHHARTLGVVRNRQTGEVGGGWKGEDRPARSYVFVRKDDEGAASPPAQQRKKRSRGDDSDSSDDE